MGVARGRRKEENVLRDCTTPQLGENPSPLAPSSAPGRSSAKRVNLRYTIQFSIFHDILGVIGGSNLMMDTVLGG